MPWTMVTFSVAVLFSSPNDQFSFAYISKYFWCIEKQQDYFPQEKKELKICFGV